MLYKKTGDLINNKLNKTTKKETEKVAKPKKYTESEIKGDVIVSLLQSHPENEKFQPEKNEKDRRTIEKSVTQS